VRGKPFFNEGPTPWSYFIIMTIKIIIIIIMLGLVVKITKILIAECHHSTALITNFVIE
jgi:hypothetical protein